MDAREYNGADIVAVSVVFLALTYLAVPLRCFVRIWITEAFKADDWLLIMAQVREFAVVLDAQGLTSIVKLYHLLCLYTKIDPLWIRSP
jgi:hypothetical protein